MGNDDRFCRIFNEENTCPCGECIIKPMCSERCSDWNVWWHSNYR